MNWEERFKQLDREDIILEINIGKRRSDGRYPVTTIFPTGRKIENLAASYCAAMNIKERYEGRQDHE